MEAVDVKIETTFVYMTLFGRRLFGFSDEALRVLFGEEGPGCREATMKLDYLDEYDVSRILRADQVTPEMRRRAIELEAYMSYESERWGRVVEGETDQQRQDRHWYTAEREVDALLGMLCDARR